MNIRRILIESRVSEFKDKYRTIYTPDQLNTVVKNVKGKFLAWVGKNLSAVNFDANFENLSELLNKFDKISSNLPIKDLYGYKSIDQLKSAISEYQNKQRRNVQKIEDANIVYGNDKTRFIVVNPLTHKASCYYGKGTKWCTSATGDQHFHRYNNEGKLFYIIDKSKPTDDKYYKVAMNLKYDGHSSYFNAVDDQFDRGWIFGTDEFEKIGDAIYNYMEKNFYDLIEIYRDEIKLNREEERLSTLNRQRVHRERMNEIERRRAENEWNLDGNCPIEGRMAWAVLNFIKSHNIETSENFDVYNLIPSGNYYEMTLFTFYGIDEFEGLEWMVGDDDDTYKSCMEYLEQLYDDIGIDSVNKYMLEAHIDTDEVVDLAREVYGGDIYDNPESYLNDSQRQLSKDQEKEIEISQRQIEQYERAIKEIKKQIYVYQNNEEELNKRIEHFKEIIERFKDEIKVINANPEGDFPEDVIEEHLDDLLTNIEKDPLMFLKDFGFEITNYVNKESLYKDIIHHDGYENLLNTYDGYLDEIRILGSFFYVGRFE